MAFAVLMIVALASRATKAFLAPTACAPLGTHGSATMVPMSSVQPRVRVTVRLACASARMASAAKLASAWTAPVTKTATATANVFP